MTADIDHPFLETLKNKLALNCAATYVPVVPESFAYVDNCFPNVRLKMERDGGCLVHGWQVWQTPFYLEAEFHGIWQSADGSLVDVTPKSSPNISKVLFLAESERVYEGRQVDNVRLNTSGNLLVEDFFALSEAIFAFQNKGERAMQHELRLSSAEAEFLKYLYLFREQVFYMLQKGGSRSSGCFCNSGCVYEYCHGEGLLEMLNGQISSRSAE